MHDELNSQDISKKMLELTPAVSFDPINSTIPMKRKYSSSSHFRTRLTASNVASEIVRKMDESVDEDDDSRASSNIAEHDILKSETTTVTANNITPLSPPSSSQSSFDAIAGDSFMSNEDNSENNLDSHSSIVFGGSSTVPSNETNGNSSDPGSSEHLEDEMDNVIVEENFDDGIRLLTEELIDNAIDSFEEEHWKSIEIDFNGETILPNGLHIVNGVAEMEFCHENEDGSRVDRFTNQLSFLKQILNKYICRYKAAGPFLNPVDSIRHKIPHYYLVIKKPMDLNTVKNRLNFLWYQSASECISDIRQIFKNCYKFNPSGDRVYANGKKLEEYFEEKLKDMPPVETEIPCPPRPSIEEYQKLVEKRNSKRLSGFFTAIDNNLADRDPSLTPSTSLENGKSVLGNLYVPIKMTTRSERGVTLKRPSKELPAPISTPPTPTPKVRKVPLNEPLKECLSFVRELFTKKHVQYAWPFWKPVDTEVYPDYLQKIKKPIDLSAIKTNIEIGKYTTVNEFAKDMRLMFSNCLRYNTPESPIIDQVRKLREVFEYKYAHFPEDYFNVKLITPKEKDNSDLRHHHHHHHSSASPSSSSSHTVKSHSKSNTKKNKSHDGKKNVQKIRLSQNESGQIISKLSKHNGNTGSAENSKSEKRMKMLEKQVACLTNALQTISRADPTAAALLALGSNGLANGTKSKTKSPKKNGYQAKNKKLSQKSSKKRKHLSSDEDESDFDEDSNSFNDISEPFNPRKMEDLQKLKDDLENLHATDLQNVLRILQSFEKSLRCDDESNVEIDFEALQPKTLEQLRKYVTSCMLNAKASPSNNHSNANNNVSTRNKKGRYTANSLRGPSNFDNDCDNSINNTWSRAGSRASNLQLSESSSSDSEIDE